MVRHRKLRNSKHKKLNNLNDLNVRNRILNHDRVNTHRNRKRMFRKVFNDLESENTQYVEDQPSISDNYEYYYSEVPVKEMLRCWANCHGITARALNDLLKILIGEGDFS